MATLADRNNNPGNIRDSSGNFLKFNSPQEGYAALMNDLQLKKTGGSSHKLSPTSTLADFAKVYAPPNENNSAQYTANLANHMGVRPDTPIKDLDVGKWAESIAKAEGYSGAQNIPDTPVQEDNGDNMVFGDATTPPKNQDSIGEQFAQGFARNLILKPLAGIGKLGEKILPPLPSSGFQGYSDENIQKGIQQRSPLATLLAPKNLENTTTAEKVGGTAGTIAGLALPSSGISKSAEGLSGLITAEGLVPNAARFATKVGVEGVGQGALGYAQSGGDPNEAILQGTVGGTLAGVGSILHAIPENLYTKIFRDTDENVEKRLFGSSSKSLARDAIDHGIKGNLPQMAQQVSKGMLDNEAKLIEWATKSNIKVPIDDKIYETLGAIYKDQSEIGRGEGADKILQIINNIHGRETDMKTALDLRRLLDGARTNASFNKAITQMRGSSADLKYWSDDLRKIINKSGGGKYMKDWQFYLDAKDSIIDAAKRSNNKSIIDYFDSSVGAGSIFAGNPLAGAAAITGRHLLSSGGKNTYAANLIKGITEPNLTGDTIKGGISNLAGKISSGLFPQLLGGKNPNNQSQY